MTKVRSYDVFDTCLTRRFARPTDLFHELWNRMAKAGLNHGISLDGPGFQAARVEAERRARLRCPREEVTLLEVWQELANMTSISLNEEFINLEMSLESETLLTVEILRRKIVSARTKGERIIFVSDTYFPKEFVKSSLLRHGLAESEDGIYVSSEIGKTKRTGNLFKHVLQMEKCSPREIIHTGDNEISDFESPKSLGIRCDRSEAAELSLWEQETAMLAGVDPLTASRIAGAMKEFRLCAEGSNETGKLVADFLGPVLFGFVAWVLAQAQRQGIKRLYFLSRDCQMAYLVAQVLTPHFRDIECRYLFVSRQALMLPSTTAISEEGMPWLRRKFESQVLSQLLAKLELTYDDVYKYWRINSDLEGNYVLRTKEDWHCFWETLNQKPLSDKLLNRIELRKKATLAYLLESGLSEPTKWALVDIGWHLSGQKAIKGLLTKCGGTQECAGYYLGLKDTRYGLAEAGAAAALFHENRGGASLPGAGESLFNYATLFEHVLGIADHSGVSHYEMEGTRVKVRFQHPQISSPQAEVALRVQRSVTAFASKNIDLVELFENAHATRCVLAKLIQSFVERPEPEMVHALTGLRAAIDQNNLDSKPLVAPVTLPQTLNLCLPQRARDILGLRVPSIFWRGGAVAITNGLQGKLLRLRKIASQVAKSIH
ncbi:MAG TPA: hypothetical protein VH595_00625 [Verrucomicrobiae bacterium]|jgi:FMN phosphatase YigB (HAD superfamily)|nr:hypothetical protein [Verrucomicrobiae bacterium]